MTRDGGNRLLNTAASAVAIAAPTITIRYTREAIGQARAKNPSMTAAVADIGKVLTAGLGGDRLLSRLDSDEFAMLIPGVGAAQALERMLQVVPTPDTYALAARLWTTFGNKPKADAVRAQARRVFSSRSAERTARR